MINTRPFRRRREKKTDYKKRLALLKSGKTRLVVRKSLNNMRVQAVNYEPSGDRTITTILSKHLKQFGWTGRTNNIPGSYLTGLLAGHVLIKKGVKEVVPDIGLQKITKGNRIFAVLKGVKDVGIKTNISKDVLPDEARIRGGHISNDMVEQFKSVKKRIEEKYEENVL